MSRIARVGRLTLATLIGLFVFSAAVVPGMLAQGTTQIEGTITGMNTTENPPILAITTDSGASYLLRAPDFSSVAGAQVGSRFRATGSAVGETFVASSIQLADANAALPPQPLAGGQTGIITGADTESLPPRLLVGAGGGSRLLILPGPDRISDIQLGATISFSGTPQGEAFLVSEWVVLSYPYANDNDEPVEEPSDNSDGNDNS